MINAPQLFIIETPAKRDRLIRLLQKLPLDGQMWDVRVSAYQPRRSVDANRRLWALHQLAAQHTGHSADELHEFCKMKFLAHRTVKVAGEEREVPERSSKLNKRAFAEFMEQVEAFYISELGVFLGDFEG
jgi:NinB protein